MNHVFRGVRDVSNLPSEKIRHTAYNCVFGDRFFCGVDIGYHLSGKDGALAKMVIALQLFIC